MYQLHEAGLLNSVLDIYTLKSKKTDLLLLDKMGEKSVDIIERNQVLKKIHLKTIVWSRIRHVGSKTSVF